jgi:hypothetical protein
MWFFHTAKLNSQEALFLKRAIVLDIYILPWQKISAGVPINNTIMGGLFVPWFLGKDFIC